jgi:rRNA maturation endonuclease Nob1
MSEITVLLVLIFIVLVIMAFRSGRKRRRGFKTLWDRLCPHCREQIDGRATRCPYCGGEVPPPRGIFSR